MQMQKFGSKNNYIEQAMLTLPFTTVTASSADEEDYIPNFVEFDDDGNRRLRNLSKTYQAITNPRLYDIWFYVPATQPIKHIGITSSQAESFGYLVERYTGVYNGLYPDNLPADIRNQRLGDFASK